MLMGNKGFNIVSLSSLMTFIAHSPDEVRTLQFVALILVFIDMAFGVACAIVCKELRSHTMRSKMVIKFVEYSVLVAIGYAATILSHAWFIVSGVYVAIMTIEVSSMLEKLGNMQKFGGVDFGRASAIISVIGGFFDATREVRSTVLTNATIISNDPNEPIIQVNTVDKMQRPNVNDKSNEKDRH